MAESEGDNGGLPVERRSVVPSTVPLSPSAALDLSYLPEAKRIELLAEYNKGMLNLSVRAQELHVDAAALRSSLETLSHTVTQTGREGNAVTASHTVTNAAGRTEVIMGNTDRARTGKLTSSQTGERDWTPIYIILGILAVVIIASAAFNR